MEVMKSSILLVCMIFMLGCRSHSSDVIGHEINANDRVLLTAFENKQTDLQVGGKGTVVRLLPDDTSGDQHQKFILELSTKQTLLISHNIDLAPKIYSLKIGDLVEFYGEYEWNSQGGVIHWTHVDPNGNHIDGWLIHNGVTYE